MALSTLFLLTRLMLLPKEIGVRIPDRVPPALSNGIKGRIVPFLASEETSWRKETVVVSLISLEKDSVFPCLVSPREWKIRTSFFSFEKEGTSFLFLWEGKTKTESAKPSFLATERLSLFSFRYSRFLEKGRSFFGDRSTIAEVFSLRIGRYFL